MEIHTKRGICIVPEFNSVFCVAYYYASLGICRVEGAVLDLLCKETVFVIISLFSFLRHFVILESIG